MTIAQSKVTAPGQISVPVEVRKKLGIGPGSVLEWHEQDGSVVVRRAGRFSSSDMHRALFPKGTPNAKPVSDVKGPSERIFDNGMLAIDTNALNRLVARDDDDQANAAEQFVGKGAWISHLVLAETLWVLDSVYDLSRAQIATAVEMVLNHHDLTLQDAEVVPRRCSIIVRGRP
ncbi:MAG: AbrB/MazE/SpoVT family DNA-binding domain-containing protein [Steroidobacteraceae bacterium]|jgi:AbrB family looped-hinge helix DNA binding protein